MSKLDDYMEEAEGHNAAEEGFNMAKDKAKGEIKDKAKSAGREALSDLGGKVGKGVSNTAGKAHNALSGRSQLYNKGAKALGAGAKKIGAGAKSAFAFAKSGPVGWAATAGLVAGSLLLFNAGGGDGVDIADDSGVGTELAEKDLTEEERIILLGGAFCPDPVYADSSDTTSGEGEGSLSNPNSDYYKNAKSTFEKWVSAGLTGEAAAGIIGWTSSEGDFHMLGRAEGHYSSNDPKEASIAYGNEPIPSLSSYEVGGGGIYQFTPYTNYAPLGSPDWEDFNKMHDFLFDQIANHGHWIAGKNDYSGKDHTFLEFASSTNIEDTTLAWNSYERMNRGSWEAGLPGIKDRKIATAKEAYEVFNGSEYKFNREAFDANFGDSSGDNVSPVDTGYTDPCIPVNMGGSPWGGEGGSPSIESGMWAHDTVPDELKQYAIDPSSVGLINGDADSWKWNTSNGHDQCTDLTANLIKLIWEKDGKALPKTQGMGNGREVAPNYADEYGGKVTNQPSAGAIFSTAEGSAMCGGAKCGHTGVVSHVFDSGNFLVIEQNVGRLSGKSAGQQNTYNYRIISAGDIKKNSYTFFDPSTVGYSFVEGIMSL